MDNFSQDSSLRFSDTPPLPQKQLTMKETKKQKKVKKISEIIATEEVNFIPHFATKSSCWSSIRLMLSLSLQRFECLDMLIMIHWETSLVQGMLQNWTKRVSFPEDKATGGHFSLMKSIVCRVAFWEVQHTLMHVGVLMRHLFCIQDSWEVHSGCNYINCWWSTFQRRASPTSCNVIFVNWIKSAGRNKKSWIPSWLCWGFWWLCH